MTIKLTTLKKTEITDSFKDWTMKTLNTLANLSQENPDVTRKLTPLGMDRIYTSLKRLPFQRFYCTKAPDGQVYLCSKSEEIIIEIDGKKYNIGSYHVCVSTRSIIAKQNNPVHLFPAYDPTTRNRHLHHTAHLPLGQEITHPLTATPSWCWASIGPSYISAVRDTDIVDIFRILYIFLIRLDWDSPLTNAWKYEAMEHGGHVE